MCTMARVSRSEHLSGGIRLNVAVTVASELSVTLHDPVPEQAPPDQPANVEPGAGIAVNATMVPSV
jgi:hypothetical protein